MKAAKINANSILLWVTILFLVSVYLIGGKPWLDDQHILESILSLALSLFCLCMIIYRVVCRTYLTSEGVICFRFWKKCRQLHWHEVSDVCLISNYRFSAGGSSDSCILIIPHGCEMYNRNLWSGIQYKYHFRHQIISIEDSFRNRRFIEAHYGKITNMRQSKSCQ